MNLPLFFLFSRFHQQALVEVKILEHLRKKVSMIVKYDLYSGTNKSRYAHNLLPSEFLRIRKTVTISYI